MSQKTVAIFTAPQGHRSIAEAAKQALESDFKVEIFFDETGLFSLYRPFYKYFPALYKLPYSVTDKLMIRSPRLLNLTSKMFSVYYKEKIANFVASIEPDLLISTYFMFNPRLLDMNKQHNMGFLNILTDPRTIHRQVVSDKASLNLAFDHYLARYVEKVAPNSRVLPIGWLVRSQFEVDYHQAQMKSRLGLDQKLTILMSSGSDGTNLILKMLPALPLITTPTQIVVACGHNQKLFNLIKKLDSWLKRVPKNQVNLIPLAFTKKIHLWMQAADLVVGKAGPNSLFESVATLTPFFATTHISGQETGNLEIIRQYHLGYVEENFIYASRLLLNIIRQPRQLNRFTPHLKRVANHNRQAKKRLNALVTNLLD